jgi:hypothetical protein
MILNMRWLVLAMLLFLAACSSGTNTGSGVSAGTNYHTGTDSLTMNFYELPSQVRSDQQFEVTVELANKGAETISSGALRLCLSGYDPYILPFGSPCQTTQQLDGKNAFNPEGSPLSYVTWRTGINLPSTVAEGFSQDLRVTGCYRYKTTANPTICVDPENVPGQKSKCTFTVKDVGSSQGGPLAVTDVQQDISSGRITLKITFENKGGGVAFSSGLPLSSCNNLNARDTDVIEVSRVMVGQTQLSCRPGGTVKLLDGKGFVLCEGSISQQTYYTTPVTIILDYNYKKEISGSVQIIKRV